MQHPRKISTYVCMVWCGGGEWGAKSICKPQRSRGNMVPPAVNVSHGRTHLSAVPGQALELQFFSSPSTLLTIGRVTLGAAGVRTLVQGAYAAARMQSRLGLARSWGRSRGLQVAVQVKPR